VTDAMAVSTAAPGVIKAALAAHGTSIRR
jgi:hypothetical protein